MAKTTFPPYSMIKKYYDLTLWDDDDMKDFYEGNALTKEEYKQITGKEYRKRTGEDKG